MVWKNRGFSFCHVSVLIVIVFGATFLLLSGCKKGQGREASPPPTVEVVDVIKKDVPVYSEWTASTDGFVNATIRAQIQGYLIKQSYKEGDLVKKGQTLFEIDPRPFEAVLEQAKGQLAQQVIKGLPLSMLFALAFGPLVVLVRDHTLGFAMLDDTLIAETVEACWHGIKR